MRPSNGETEWRHPTRGGAGTPLQDLLGKLITAPRAPQAIRDQEDLTGQQGALESVGERGRRNIGGEQRAPTATSSRLCIGLDRDYRGVVRVP